jgi:hypothetical protein
MRKFALVSAIACLAFLGCGGSESGEQAPDSPGLDLPSDLQQQPPASQPAEGEADTQP